MTPSTTNNTAKSSNYIFSITIIGVLFFIFGFVTWLNGSLIPFLQTACRLTPFEASLVTLAFYISYFFMALPSSFVLRITGYKNGMALGLLIMSLGALLFIPAAYTRMFGIFLTGLFIMGTGLALLQTASNPYITIIGPLESAATRISIMGICNKMAGFIGPLVLTALVMTGMDRFSEEALQKVNFTQQNLLLDELAARLVLPYIGMAVALIFLGLMIKMSPLPNRIAIDDDEEENLKDFIKQIPKALKIQHLALGVLAIFVYVGIEVIAGDSIGQFGKYLGLKFASKLTSFTMAFMVVGYIIGIITIPKYIKQANALKIASVIGMILTCGIIFSDPQSTSWFDFTLGWLNNKGFHIPVIPNPIFFLASLGLANAIMWPAIWPLALNNLGKLTKIASALLIMGIIGGALIPPSYVFLSQKIGYQTAIWVGIPIYLYILYYATLGHKIRR